MSATDPTAEIERLTAERDRLRRAGKFQQARKVSDRIDDLTDPEQGEEE